MIKITQKEKCCGCSSCAQRCPKDCIEMKRDDEGFLYPHIEENKCINCHICDNVCPMTMNNECSQNSQIDRLFAVINIQDDERKQSSSGGLFPLLARNILLRGGTVCGAAWADDYRSVKHIVVSNSCNLQKLQGSKYVQSDINGVYQIVEKELKSNNYVLFSGTPCQTAGLKSYLRYSYERLYTCDIICHGVPSSTVWEQYLQWIEKRMKGKVWKVEFRSKNDDGKIRVNLDSGEYLGNPHQDPFNNLFLRNYILRPSCYKCAFKGNNHQSDITIGDFWRIESVLPTFGKKGDTSIAIVHTEKGQKLFDELQKVARIQEVQDDDCLRFNTMYQHSSKHPQKREQVYALLKKNKFALVFYFYGFESWKSIVIRILEKLHIKQYAKKILKKENT